MPTSEESIATGHSASTPNPPTTTQPNPTPATPEDPVTIEGRSEVEQLLSYFEKIEMPKIQSFDGNGWSSALAGEKLLWACYAMVKEVDKLPASVTGTNHGAAARLRSDIGNGHHITELLSTTSKRFVRGIDGDTESEVNANIAAAVLDVLGVLPRVSAGLLNRIAHVNSNKIKEFHSKLDVSDSQLTYANDAEKTTLTTETSLSALAAAQRDFLERNLELLQTKITEFNAQAKEIVVAKQLLIDDVDARLSVLRSADNADSPDVRAQIETLESQRATYQSAKHAATEDTPEISKSKTTIAEIKKQMKLTDTLDVPTGKYGSAADVASSALSIGKVIANMSKFDGTSSVESVTAESFSLANSLLGLGSAGLDIKDSAKYGKFVKGFALAGAVSGVGTSAASMAGYVGKINDPNLTAQQREMMKAEVGLQSVQMVLTAVEGGLSIAQTAVTAGSKAASFLGKAVPLIGAVASVAGAINPGKWAEFKQKEDQIDKIRDSDDFSSGLLGDLLDDTLVAEKGYYAATTVIDAVTGIGAAALAASGIGAGFAVLAGLIGGAVSAIIQATQQVALEAIADRYAEKMRTDDDGGSRTIEEYFEGSFEQRQQKLKDKYQDMFDEIIDSGHDDVVALGSQTLSSSDLTLAGITKTGGELGKTAKHFFEEYSGQGHWERLSHHMEGSRGNQKVYLPDKNDANHSRYVTFMSPLMAAGDEGLTRRKTGKNEFYTNLEIKNLRGWHVIDQGASNTVFTTDQLVASGEFASGEKMDLNFEIDAGLGDDTFVGGQISTNFKGGDGSDTATYANLDVSDLTTGLSIGRGADRTALYVNKTFKAGTKYLQETIESTSVSQGKRSETIEYRQVSMGELSNQKTYRDVLLNIEVLQTTELRDVVDLRGVDVVKQLYTFDGNDQIWTGDSLLLVSAGRGDDLIRVGKSLETLFAEDGNDTIIMDALSFEDYWRDPTDPQDTSTYIDGGAGEDVISASRVAFRRMAQDFGETMEAQKMADALAQMITFGQASDSDLNIFRNLMNSTQATPDGIYINNIEWFKYNVTDRNMAIAPEPVVDGSLFGATSATYLSSDWIDADDLKDWVPSQTPVRSGNFTGALSSETLRGREMKHISGQLWLEAGETYEFKESVNNIAAIYINGKKVLTDGDWDKDTTGRYTAIKTGLVKVDFFAHNPEGWGHYRFHYRNIKDSQFKDIIGIDSIPDHVTDKFRFKTAQLNDISTGNEFLDHIFYSSEYRQVFEHMVKQDGKSEVLSSSDAFDTTVVASATIVTYDGVTLGKLFTAYRMKSFADSNRGQPTESLDGDFSGSLADKQMKHISGKLFVEAGKTYKFEESSDDWSSLYINGTRVLADQHSDFSGTGQYTAAETGYVTLDYYAWNWGGPGSYQLKWKYSGSSSSYTLFKGTPIAPPPPELELFQAYISHYTDLPQGCYTLDAVKSWMSDNGSHSFEKTSANLPIETRIPGSVARVITGKLYLEKGYTYSFRETVKFNAELVIGDKTVISDGNPNQSATGSFTATESGYYSLSFLAHNWLRYGGPMKLEYRIEGKTTEWSTLSIGDDNNAPESKTKLDLSASSLNHSVQIIGDHRSEKLEGSRFGDFIFGGDGDDIIEGGEGNDVLVGGSGNDTFVFKTRNGHDVLLESGSEGFDYNRLEINRPVGALEFIKNNNDLIITDRLSENWSVTLGDYFDGAHSAQRLVDQEGGVSFLNQYVTFQNFSDSSANFRYYYNKAMREDLIEDAREAYSSDGSGDWLTT